MYKDPDYMKKYRQTHRERIKEQHQKNHERLYTTDPLYRAKMKKASQKHYQIHKEEVRKQHNEWYKNHKEQKKNQQEKWRLKNPKRFKEYDKRHKSKRRKLKFDPLNEPFAGSVGHHIDFETIIYIPEQLHNSIRHSVLRNWNMEKINDKVFEWLIEHGDST